MCRCRTSVARVILISSTLLLWSVAGLKGETASHRQDDSDDLIAEALHCEIYGRLDERQRLLSEAERKDPESDAAKWHQGYVKYQGKWMAVDSVPIQTGKLDTLQKYLATRQEASDTYQDHLRLADLCQRLKLPEQERAHLIRALDFNFDDLELRKRLGHVRVSGQWFDKSELDQQRTRMRELRSAVIHWSSRLNQLLEGASSPNREVRDNSLASIRALNDPAAIPAMELVFWQDKSVAAAAVEALSRMKHPEAALALSRYAVFHENTALRRQAAEALRGFPRREYVPQLISMLENPVATRIEFALARGQLLYRHHFLREGVDEDELLTLDIRYSSLFGSGIRPNEAVFVAASDIASREAEVSRANHRIAELNQLVTTALNIATEQLIPLPPDADRWADWWQNEIEIVRTSEKPIRNRYGWQVRPVAPRNQGSYEPAPEFGSVAFRLAHPERFPAQFNETGFITLTRPAYWPSCFAAGTSVMSVQGAMPIEKVRVGDLILSQHPETGELAYKGVVRTTVRPPATLIRLDAGRDRLTATGGHLFWMCGEGWTKARDLQSGMLLHAVTGSVPVLETTEVSAAETYNLVVADFHTYFVGHERILVHDNTSPRPSTALVPGLAVGP